METAIWLRKRDMLKDHFLQCPLEGGGALVKVSKSFELKLLSTKVPNPRQPWRPFEMVPGGLFDPPADAEEAKLTLEARTPPRPGKTHGLFSTSKQKVRGVATGIRDSGLGDGGITVPFFFGRCMIDDMSIDYCN